LPLPEGRDDDVLIHVVHPEGRTITLSVCLSFRIDVVKAMVKAIENIPRYQQVLVFQNETLMDEDTLINRGVQVGSTMQLKLELSGGAKAPKAKGVKKDELLKQHRTAKQERAKVDFGNTVDTAVKELDRVMDDFYAGCETNSEKAFEILFDKLPLEYLEKAVEMSHFTNDEVVRQEGICKALFAPVIAPVQQKLDSLSGVVESTISSFMFSGMVRTHPPTRV
jgi:hypothetical protein